MKVACRPPSTQQLLAAPAEGAAAAPVGRECRGPGGHRAGPGPAPAAYSPRAAVCAPLAEPQGHHGGGRWQAARRCLPCLSSVGKPREGNHASLAQGTCLTQEAWFEKDRARLCRHGCVLGVLKGHVFAPGYLRYLALAWGSPRDPERRRGVIYWL